LPDDGRPDWPVRRRVDEVAGSKPATPTGPGSEPTSVTHGSFLYNSIHRFDDQAAAPPPTAARKSLTLDYLVTYGGQGLHAQIPKQFAIVLCVEFGLRVPHPAARKCFPEIFFTSGEDAR
jgi:hypothetical protein